MVIIIMEVIILVPRKVTSTSTDAVTKWYLSVQCPFKKDALNVAGTPTLLTPI